MTDKSDTGERIAKVMARAGVASRRDAERLILEGRVTVNGQTVTSPALDVQPNDKVMLDGKPIDAPQPARLWLYYKPLGLVTSEKDEKGRQTVFESLPDGMPRVLSVGRLDLNSEGLLLLTNDGALKRRLELPSTGWLRKYRVRVNGRPNAATFDPLKRGITIDGEEFQPMEITLDRQQGANAWLTVGLREGKNREVRRAMAEIGLTVNRLIRVSYGPFRLNEMKPGEVIEVKQRVLRDQLGDGGEDDERKPRSDARNTGGAERGASDRGPRRAGGPGDGDRPERRPRPRPDTEEDRPRKPRGTPARDQSDKDRPYRSRSAGDDRPQGPRPSGDRPPRRDEADRDRKPARHGDPAGRPGSRAAGERAERSSGGRTGRRHGDAPPRGGKEYGEKGRGFPRPPRDGAPGRPAEDRRGTGKPGSAKPARDDYRKGDAPRRAGQEHGEKGRGFPRPPRDGAPGRPADDRKGPGKPASAKPARDDYRKGDAPRRAGGGKPWQPKPPGAERDDRGGGKPRGPGGRGPQGDRQRTGKPGGRKPGKS